MCRKDPSVGPQTLSPMSTSSLGPYIKLLLGQILDILKIAPGLAQQA